MLFKFKSVKDESLSLSLVMLSSTSVELSGSKGRIFRVADLATARQPYN